jgi:hypothetical protein
VSDPVRDYWAECVAIAANDCGLTLTEEQLQCLAGAMESGHEHYGLAFYTPPASDRISDVQRECDRRLAEQRAESQQQLDAARERDEDRARVIRRQAWRIEELQEAANKP